MAEPGVGELSRLLLEKRTQKKQIQEWLKDFEEKNHRPANNRDKAAVRELFLGYKRVCSKLKALDPKKASEVVKEEEEGGEPIVAAEHGNDGAGEDGSNKTHSGPGKRGDDKVREADSDYSGSNPVLKEVELVAAEQGSGDAGEGRSDDAHSGAVDRGSDKVREAGSDDSGSNPILGEGQRAYETGHVPLVSEALDPNRASEAVKEEETETLPVVATEHRSDEAGEEGGDDAHLGAGGGEGDNVREPDSDDSVSHPVLKPMVAAEHGSDETSEEGGDDAHLGAKGGGSEKARESDSDDDSGSNEQGPQQPRSNKIGHLHIVTTPSEEASLGLQEELDERVDGGLSLSLPKRHGVEEDAKSTASSRSSTSRSSRSSSSRRRRRGSNSAKQVASNCSISVSSASDAPEVEGNSSSGEEDSVRSKTHTQRDKLNALRERFLAVKALVTEDLSRDGGSSPHTSPKATMPRPGETLSPAGVPAPAKNRWNLLSKAVNPNAGAVSPPVKRESKVLQEGGEDEALDPDDLTQVELLFEEGLPPPPPPAISASADIEGAIHDIEIEALPNYTQEYEQAALESELVVSSVPVEDLERREREIEEARYAAAQREAGLYRRREANLLYREEAARQDLSRMQKVMHERVFEDRKWTSHRFAVKERALGRMFLRAKLKLEAKLNAQRSSITERFGRIEVGEGVAGRRYNINWNHVPQPIEVRIHMIRAAKDKLPKGKYVVLVSMAERLGGGVLKWSKHDPAFQTANQALGGLGPAATAPVRHGGRFFDRELDIQQSVFQLCPSRDDLRPSNVLIFEVFQLAGPRNAMDRVVGWGALPMASHDFQVVQGRFRLPLLSGEQDPLIQLHCTMEKLYTEDLSAWLSNMYVEVRHLPKAFYRDGTIHKEYDVEYDHINRLLKLGPTDREVREGHKRRHSCAGDHAALMALAKTDSTGGGEGKGAWWEKAGTIFHPSRTLGDAKGEDESAASNDLEAGSTALEERRKDDEGPPLGQGQEDQAWDESHISSAEALQGKGGAPRLAGKKREEGSRWDLPGLGLAGGGDSKKAAAAAAAAASHASHTWHRPTEAAEMEYYTLAVAPNPGRSSKPTAHVMVRNKLRYIRQELFMDLNPSSCRSPDYWLSMALLLMALWLRMYLHFLGQWAFLKYENVPIYGFSPTAYEIPLKYIDTSVTLEQEIELVVYGPLFVMACFGFLVAAAAAGRRALGGIPELASRFVAAFGVATVLDPLLIFAADLMLSNYDCNQRCSDYTASGCSCHEGDAWKIPTRLEREESSAINGVLITLTVYSMLMLFSCGVLYTYFLHMHFNGRILDAWRRLNGSEKDFFVPHDLEVSVAELDFICAQARRWQGPSGARREIVVAEYDYEPAKEVGGSRANAEGAQETTSHIAIYTCEVDGSQVMHRSFMQGPDGVIVELFGDICANLGSRFQVPDQLLSRKADGHFQSLLSP